MNRYFFLFVLMVFASCSSDKDELHDDKPKNVESCIGYENGHAYVDLGLPSGLKWATMNVGATSVIDYGNYYAWGETKAFGEKDTSNGMNYKFNSQNSYTKSVYDWETYKWCNGSYNSMIKYSTNSSYGNVDNKITLDLEDDAAVQNWGGAWRIPTHEELEELEDDCYWVWTSSYDGSGVAGYIVYAAKLPLDKGLVVYNGNTSSSNYSLSDIHIFLPAAGCHEHGDFGTWGYYWSSSLHESICDGAWGICFDSSCRTCNDSYSRYGGYSVRAVLE